MKTQILDYTISLNGQVNQFLVDLDAKVRDVLDSLDLSGLTTDEFGERVSYDMDDDGDHDTVLSIVWDVLGKELNDVEFETAADKIGISMRGRLTPEH